MPPPPDRGVRGRVRSRAWRARRLRPPPPPRGRRALATPSRRAGDRSAGRARQTYRFSRITLSNRHLSRSGLPGCPPSPLMETPLGADFLQSYGRMVVMSERPAVLLVAHGTRDPRGAVEMDILAGLLRQRLDVPVGHAWLEDFAEPHVGVAVDVLVTKGVRRIVSL